MKKALIAAAVAMVLPAAANAQEITPFPGVYVLFGGGIGWDVNNLNAGTGWGFGGQVGYDFLGPRVALEVSYSSLHTNGRFPGTFFNGDHHQLLTMVNGYYDFAPAARFSPYVGVGVGVAFIDSNTPLGDTQFAYQGMVGLSYKLTNNFAVGIEGRYIGTTNPSFRSGGRTFTYSNDSISALVGVAYKFGGPSYAAAPPPQQQAPIAQPPSFMVFFDFDRSDLSAQAQGTIQQAANAYKTKGSARVTATGHADRSGPDAYNMALSLRRANTVKDALVRNGVPATAIAVVGRGEASPLVQTADGVREPQNRRVEIVIQ